MSLPVLLSACVVLLAVAASITASTPEPLVDDEVGRAFEPVTRHSVEPKLWDLRAQFISAYAQDPEPESKMSQDDAERYRALSGGTFEVIIWAEGEAHTHFSGPEAAGWTAQDRGVAVDGRIFTSDERDAVESIRPITGTSDIFPFAVVQAQDKSDVVALAEIPTVYLIEIEPDEGFTFFDLETGHYDERP